jgi:NAD(P)-dependent dehydrogenase (short-subunit alcohol dehydrogenase family)
MAGKWFAYGQRKLANVLYASQLSKRYQDITTIVIHPGLVHTGLTSHLGLLDQILAKVATLRSSYLNVQQGAYNTLWAATADKNALRSGGFYEPVGRPVSGTTYSEDQALAQSLWDWTERELQKYAT